MLSKWVHPNIRWVFRVTNRDMTGYPFSKAFAREITEHSCSVYENMATVFFMGREGGNA